MPKSIEDQIKDLENTRAATVGRLQKITQKAADEGRSMTEDEQTEFDELQDNIDMIDQDLVRLKRLEKQMAVARPINRQTGEDASKASQVRQGGSPRIEINAAKREKGVGFARVVRCMALSRLNVQPAEAIAKKLYGDRDPQIVDYVKAAVEAGTTDSENWAGALVGEETSLFADFVEYLRPQTILGRFGQDGVPALTRLGFRVPSISQTEGGDGYWVGEGKPKPLTKFNFDRTTLEPRKVANIVVLTQEQVRDSSPSSDIIVRDQMVRALRARMDIDFIDPGNSGGTNTPASVTNAVSAPASSGPTADHVRQDIKTLFASFIAANNTPTTGVWIMSATTALALSLMVNTMGTPEFPGITMNGGALFGLPVIVSEHVPTASSGGYVFLVNASDIYLGDEGDISVDMSREASLEMQDDDSLSQDQPVGASLVSLWQNNLVGFLAERTINWKKRRASAVAALSEVNWGSLTT